MSSSPTERLSSGSITRSRASRTCSREGVTCSTLAARSRKTPAHKAPRGIAALNIQAIARRAGIPALAAALALAASACGSDDGAGGPAGTAAAPAATTGTTATETAEPANAPAIVVETPKAGDRVTSPVTVSGSADVFEANVLVFILAGGEELAHTFTTATCGSGCRGEFSVDVPFEVQAERPATILVHDEDAADEGKPPHEVRIPVMLTP